jgi:serine/threonine protein kinase
MQNSPARATVDVGSVIAGTYTIEALLGRGGMGAVFLASHNRLPGKKVAIKMLHAEITGDEMLARFRREAQIASMLGHPNIVHVEDFDVLPDGTPYLVLEYLQGVTLAHRIAEGPVAMEQIMSIVRQVGSALQAAHRAGIVHRDLKPQNIFLVPTEIDGRSFELAKVLDFGISKMRGSQTVQTQDSALLGTPQYMAPEQATGQHSSVDERTDIFALGAIVYEMLAGHPAFQGASIPEVVFKVVYEQPAPLATDTPPPIAKAVNQALAKPAGERFATVNQFVEALTGEALPVTRPASIPPADPSTPSKRVKSTGNDAFARTMGSGDAAKSFVAVDAPTLPSQSGALIKTLPPPAPEKKRSRAPMIAALVLGAAAIAGGAFYFGTREGDQPKRPPEPPPTPVEVAKPTPPPPPPPPKVEPKPEPKVEPAKPPPPPKPPVVAKQPPPAPPKQPAESEVEGNSELKQHLKEAEAALGQKEWEKARSLANFVLDQADVPPQARAHASMITGIAACQKNHDQEAAQRALRQLNGHPKFRSRLIEQCHQADVTIQ